MEKAPQVIKSSKKIAEEFKPKEKEIIALAKELQAMKKKYNKNKSIMSADKARVFERKIIAQQKKVQRLRNDIQEDINIRKNQALQKIQDLINQSITFVGKKNNYDIIFYEGIAYNNDKADITPLVLKRLKAIDK
ncbi:Outer membrane protein H precursor [hydrothermal vent metagenome]|uniref:Outer membrane protein H n=1 Tax=hydrothermal vent metagenome TaxID=652676 RepID=A0A1W1BF90_9ZZZZ